MRRQGTSVVEVYVALSVLCTQITCILIPIELVY